MSTKVALVAAKKEVEQRERERGGWSWREADGGGRAPVGILCHRCNLVLNLPSLLSICTPSFVFALTIAW